MADRNMLKLGWAIVIAILLVLTCQAQEKSSSGPQEGIHVHGHWTLTVRNADGSFVSRHEFENSLTNDGKRIIITQLVLPGAFPLDLEAGKPSWALDVGGALCTQKDGSLAHCIIPLNLDLDDKALHLPNDPGSLVMSGTVKIGAAGPITSVATTLLPSARRHVNMNFTFRDLTQPDPASGQTLPPINVQAGQNVDVTVVIHFM
jgi:hypothetical protein